MAWYDRFYKGARRKVRRYAGRANRSYLRWNQQSPRKKYYGTWKRAARYALRTPRSAYRSVRRTPRTIYRRYVPWGARQAYGQGYKQFRRRVSFKYKRPAFGFRVKNVRRKPGDWYGSRPYRYGRYAGRQASRFGRWWYNDPRGR